MVTIAIVGAGMMGSALVAPCLENGHAVRLVGTPLDHDIIAQLEAGAPHPKLRAPLPGPVTPYFVAQLAAALDGADVIALGVSSAGVRWAAEALGPALAELPRPVLMISKGLVWQDGRLDVLPDVFQSLLPAAAAAVTPVGVAGPCIAGELLRGVPTSVVLTGRSVAACEGWAQLLRGPFYTLHVEPDLLGAETCAALKNAFAMGVGFGAGVHEARGGAAGSVAYHNYESAVFAQAILEMQKVVALVGGDPQTAVGLPGTGDLTVTCNGGRTGRFGKWLGTGISLAEAVEKMEGATLECLEVLRELELALTAFDAVGKTRSDELPLLRHLIDVALHGAAVAMPFERFGRR